MKTKPTLAPVIVVHHDPDTLATAVNAVRAAGHTAIGLGDPMNALIVTEADPRVPILVTGVDFGPGKLNGIALARMVKRKSPAVRVVFVAHRQDGPHADGAGVFLPMPLDAQALVDAVGSTDDEPAVP